MEVPPDKNNPRRTSQLKHVKFVKEFVFDGNLEGEISSVDGILTIGEKADVRAKEGLNLFRSLAKDNGIDPEIFINSLGGEPSFSDCEQSAQQFNS